MSSFLTDQSIDVAALAAEVASPGCGAVITFLGTVRSAPEDGDVIGIDYSAYPAMADAEFGRIMEEALARWPAARIAMRHRTGYIPTGEASIAVLVAMGHRGEAYDCSRYLIEQTKARVPIWKKERLRDGTSDWVEPGV
jgi:molybdopterin synthase catalytic subunit